MNYTNTNYGNNVALARVTLRGLQPDINNIFVIGIIIAKQKPKKFRDVKGLSADSYKAVWNFTLRDSPKDYINVTYWGKAEDVCYVNEKFHLGDIIEVINPRVNIRKINDYGEQFRPMVTSPFTLMINEDTQVRPHPGHNTAYFVDLLRLPTKPIAGFVSINQIHANGKNLINEFVDVLGVLRGIRGPRAVTTSAGESLQVCELEIFDMSSPSLKISIWDSDIIQKVTSWTPRYTVLFITDLKISWSEFHRAYDGKTTSRTIITENPACKETEALLNYAKNAPIETFEVVDQLLTTLPEPNQIQDVMSVNQVQNKVNAILQGISDDIQFTAVLYAFVTEMDLDGLSQTTLAKCGRCGIRISTGFICENPECPASLGREPTDPQSIFDMKICVSDHTGTLINCYFRGHSVERTFGCTIQDFLLMTDDQKRELKWRYILERCAIRIFVMINRGKPIISIVNIAKENELEMASKIPVH